MVVIVYFLTWCEWTRCDGVISPAGRYQHLQCSSSKAAAEAAPDCNASVCPAQLQACSGRGGQGESHDSSKAADPARGWIGVILFGLRAEFISAWL